MADRLTCSIAMGRTRLFALDDSVLFFDGRFDTFPEIVLWLLVLKELFGRIGDRLKVLVEPQAIVLADLDMGMVFHIRSGTDEFRELVLELLAAHRFGIDGHRRPPLWSVRRSASRNLSRALWSWDLLFPTEQSSMAAISLCSKPSTS